MRDHDDDDYDDGERYAIIISIQGSRAIAENISTQGAFHSEKHRTPGLCD